jgi:hypothetical protein
MSALPKGTKVRRSPKDFANKSHPALKMRGEVVGQYRDEGSGKILYRVNWDDGGKAYGYLRSELEVA